MNVRKPVDYSAMYTALNKLMMADLTQMELYCEIGRLVNGRPERGAAVMVAEYLQSTYPEAAGFSPRNLRRMREFYRTYGATPEMLAEAMTIGWTQNVVILEADLAIQERMWYIQAIRKFGWSKLELIEKIQTTVHLELTLDLAAETCYTNKEETDIDCRGKRDPEGMVRDNMEEEAVYECIYTRSTEPAIKAEHIFPKCIGGVGTLPVGYVADRVNTSFSKLELGFARQYPPVVISRMFSVPMGRKKHRNRERVGLMKDRDNNGEYMLGFVRNGIPMAIDQIVISMGQSNDQNHSLPVRIVVGPNEKMSKEEQISAFWERLKNYNGSPTCIKDLNVPPKTCLLGAVDNRWILCIAKNENPEDIKLKLKEIVDQITTASTDMLLTWKSPVVHEQQVEAEFSFTFNYVDVMRVYAKIAVNCLAKVKGHDFVMDSALAEIKQAILTGEDIEKYTTYAKGPNPIPESLRAFPDRVLLGERLHCAVFFQDDQGDLIAFIALFGTDDPVAIKLGRFKERVGVDFYLCDWEHKADYTMTDFVLKVCKYDEEYELK